MADITTSRFATNIPLTLVVTGNQGGAVGLITLVAIRDGATDDSYLDFADSTFKTSGWTTRQAPLFDAGGGTYTLSGGLDATAITNLPAATFHLFAEYEITTGGSRGVALDTVIFSDIIADAVWDEPSSEHTTVGTFGELLEIVKLISARSGMVIDGGAGVANVVTNATGFTESARLRVFLTAGEADAATKGAADDADGEIFRCTWTGVANPTALHRLFSLTGRDT